MQILIDGKIIIAYAPKITFGIYDEPFEKWRMSDENDKTMYYAIDHNYKLIKDVDFPEDYVDGKYFYVDGGLVLNEDWQPYVSIEDKVNNLETESSLAQNAIMEQQETNAVLEGELVSTQLALAEQYEVNIALEEELVSSQSEIIELQLAICDLYEALLG